MPHPNLTSWLSNLKLSSHPRVYLPSGLFPSGLPTKILYVPVLSSVRATCPAHLILLDFITFVIWCGVQIMKLLFMQFSPVSLAVCSNVFLSTIFSDTHIKQYYSFVHFHTYVYIIRQQMGSQKILDRIVAAIARMPSAVNFFVLPFLIHAGTVIPFH